MSRALWFPVNVAQWVLGCLYTALCVTLALGVRVVTGNTRMALGMARWLWAPGMLALCGARVEVEGGEAIDWSRPYFVASNHQSYLDIAVLFRHLPVNLHFVVKNELRHVPFLAWYIRAMGMIFVHRSNPEAAKLSIRRVADAASGGKTILLFPEGTRSRDGSIRRLKSGILAAAAESSVPILPVALDGPNRILPPGFSMRPGKVRLVIGTPIETDEYRVDDRRILAERVRSDLVELHELARLR